MKYRPEIDGLRTIAVLPVILFHAEVAGLHGGFIGVDIFFVISGFLITTILVQDLEAGRHSIWTFYERRARRILPALFTVVLACLPFAWMWMFPEQLRDFGQSVVATALFSSNILFWKEAGYFSSGVDLKPLLHTWSLAIEEQYYIIFPVLLALAWQLGRKALFVMVLAIAVVSLGLAQVMSFTNPDFNFYLLPTRAWELMIGGLGAFWMLWRKPAASQALAALGALCVLSAFVLFDAGMPHPSVWTLLPVAGTTLILVFAREGTFVASVLSLRPLVAIGLISYSAYLWHQPLFAFARLRSITDPTPTLMLSLALLSLVLATLTWKFVEEPFRRHKGRAPRLLPRRRPLLGASAVAIVAVVGIGGTLHVIDGAPWRVPAEAIQYSKIASVMNPVREPCHQKAKSPEQLQLPPPAVCTSIGKPNALHAVIVGDSHADAFAFPVRESLEKNGWQSTQLTISSCQPVPGIKKGTQDCLSIYKSILEYLAQGDYDLIIVGERIQSLYGMNFDNGEGGREPVGISSTKESFDPAELGISGPLTRAEFADAAIKKGILDFLNLGIPVLSVHAIPEAGWQVPYMAAKHALFLDDLKPTITTNRLAYEVSAGRGNSVLDSIDSTSLFHIRPADHFCTETRCTNAHDGKVYYYDDDHLSLTGAKIIADAVVAQLPKIEKIIKLNRSEGVITQP